LEKAPVVYIEWVDAVADAGWQEGTKTEIHKCYTLGWIVSEADDAICVANTVSMDSSNARMHIPKSEPDDVRSVSMGVSGEDLLLSPAARRKLPISVECKSRASISVYGHYQQAKDNCRGFEPVLVIKQNRDKPLVVVDCEYFFELLRKVSNDNL